MSRLRGQKLPRIVNRCGFETSGRKGGKLHSTRTRPRDYHEQMPKLLLAFVFACTLLPAQTLNGVIDIHVHCDPDDSPRSIDAIDIAKLARDRGMRGLVLKNHYESTESIAFLVRKVVPGIEIFGGIDLNRTVGGINPAAVEHMTRMTGGFGRVVWLPTFDAENQVRFSKENRPFVSVAKNGSLLPEVQQVIGLAANHHLLL